ncbi:MAG: bifunctional lysylphosphatidylglycerol flippase/synthetase MprF [Pseudomonadota bacterium]
MSGPSTISAQPHSVPAGVDASRPWLPALLRARWLAAVFAAALLAVALYILHRELSAAHLASALQSARNIPARTLFTALAFTAASYLVLSLYDFLSLRYLRKRVGRARTLLTAFVAYAFSHNLSFAAVTGGAVRYRLYGKRGLTLGDVALLTAFSSLTLGTGFVLIAGLSLLIAPAQVAAVLSVDPDFVRVAGCAALLAVGAYVVLAADRERLLKLGKWTLRTPGPWLAPLQPAIGVLDLALASAVLWTLIPAEANLDFVTFAGVYVLACMAGILSYVPGGVGVFESVILLLLPQVPRDALAGALIAYRAIYYLLPLLIAGLAFAAVEIDAQRARLAIMGRAVQSYLRAFMPQLAAAFVFVAAAVLLLSGATPGMESRLVEIRRIASLPVLELSHLAGSAVGMALLILARALSRRVRAAYFIACWLLLAGIVASLLKGLDYEEAVFLALVLLFLRSGRAAFYRSSALLQERFTPGWTISVVAVLALVIWVGFVAQRHVAYSNELWWTFALHGEASRMLRAAVVAAIVAATFLFANLLGPPRATSRGALPFDASRVRAALDCATTSLAQAVLAGDKRVLLSDSRRAFIMYQVARHSWVTLGEPVGARCEHQELVWRFRELSDRNGGRTVFYQVSGEHLPLYVDLGLVPLKIGEEARVPLPGFSLDGSARAELRQAHRRVARGDATFEIVPAAQTPALMPALRAISDAWLIDKATAEKGFSVGMFSETYLQNFPIALVRCGGTPVAFANLWTTPEKDELSVDLMRFGAAAPRGTMDFLFVELMSWARAEGYGWFNLGMAPLSGLGTHPLAPAWHQLGNFVYRHGEHFYNFAGLRRYKAKFHPVWEPRYLVAPGGLGVPRILTDISILIAGGLKGLITK